MTPDVRICADVNALGLRAGEAAVHTINDAVRRHGRCSLVLSGGSTPRTLYALLASEFRGQIPWGDVHLFWGDERYVPVHDPNSNYRMAREMLLDQVPCRASNLHPMPTSFPSPDAAARDYERTLRGFFDGRWPRFDLVLLGLGDDAHTASLFPHSPALKEATRWAVAVRAPTEPSRRLTLTLPVLTRAATIYFLVAGSKKAEALRHVLAGAADQDAYPASGVRSSEGTVIWWVDREAASQLPVGAHGATGVSDATPGPRSDVEHE